VRIISIINQKGGCGKTTSAINLAGLTARRGFRTLLVDLDPQSHCAAGLAIPEQRIDLDIGDAMLTPDGDPIDPTRLFWRASRNLDLAPSRMKLAGLEAARGGLAERPDKERRLAAVLARFAHSYDACFIDCPPSVGLLTYNALAASTDVLIPVETSFFALQGATKQVNTIRALAKRLASAAPYWLVATLHDEGSALARDLLDELRRRFGKRVAPPVIRRDLTLKEAASFGQPIAEYAPESPGAADYSALADWLAGVVGLVAGTPGVPVPQAPPDLPEVVVVAEPKPAPPLAVFAPPPPGFDPPVPPASSESISRVAALAGKLQHLSTPTDAPAEPGQPTRAGEVAQRARALLLKRADEQLRMLAGAGPQEMIAAPPGLGSDVESKPLASRDSHPTLRVIEEPKPGLEALSSARSQSLRHLYGIRNTRSGTLFVQPLTMGDRLAVAGDFTGWMPVPMRRNESAGAYELCLPLPAGRREYRLVIDGRWMADPFNEHSETNPFGELNSVFIVEPPAAPEQPSRAEPANEPAQTA
jgi:chromosome partitioning protein